MGANAKKWERLSLFPLLFFAITFLICSLCEEVPSSFPSLFSVFVCWFRLATEGLVAGSCATQCPRDTPDLSLAQGRLEAAPEAKGSLPSLRL
jgi:hypothetical protein